MQETERLGHYKIILPFLILNSLLFSQSYPDKRIDSLLKAGINEIIIQNYDTAENIFIQLKSDYPSNPFGKIYLAALEIARAYDYAIPFDEEKIENHLNEAIDLAEESIELDESNIWDHYSLALAKGYFAYYEALQHNWLSAFSDGLDAISELQFCLDTDSTFYEAYIALGTYKYWKSRKTEFLNWMPFINDEREDGIKFLRKAVKGASYNTYLAINSLIWIYIDKAEFEKAAIVASEALEDYPFCRLFQWGLARAYEDIDRDSSIFLYRQILDSYSDRNDPNLINRITLKHIIAQLYVKEGDYQNALILCKEILSSSNLTDFAQQKLEERIRRVENLYKKIIK